jgi:hypothetical protein
LIRSRRTHPVEIVTVIAILFRIDALDALPLDATWRPLCLRSMRRSNNKEGLFPAQPEVS